MMRVWFVLGLLLGAGAVLCGAWEDWLLPLALMKHQRPRPRLVRPRGIYARPVGPHVGWNTPGTYRRGPVRDALWYDNNT